MSGIALRGQRSLGMAATRTLTRSVLYLLLTLGAIVATIPMAWTVSSSLKDTAHIFTLRVQWLPNPIIWHNYIDLFARLPFLQFITNTLLIVVSNVIASVLTGSLVAYAFARLRAPGRNFLFMLVISTMLLPGQVTLIPRYIIFNKLNMIDTYWPLVIPGWLGGGAFEIFLFRQFFLTLPVELDDAARIDGCSTLRIYWSIVMPLSKPVIATIAIFNFIWAWSDFFNALIYLNSMEKFTLPLGLATLQRSAEWSTRWELVMAGSVVSLIPMLVIFFLGQKYFVQGITLTGVKA
ncbi:MAG: carbohydrate ABC transporter permease [Caldilineaceae bacterium]